MRVSIKLSMSLVLVMLIVLLSVSYGAALEASAPTITSFSPTNASTVDKSAFEISFTVNDADDNIKNGDYSVKLDGVAKTASLSYPGYYDWDPESGYSEDNWVISTYQQATITAQVSGVSDGAHTVVVEAMDVSGHKVTQSWTFTSAVKPVFSDPKPADQTATNNNKGFSIKVADNSALNPQSIKGELDNVPVKVNFDAVTGLVTYPDTIPDGVHKAKVTAADAAGNISSKEWSFTVRTQGPELIFAGSGKTYQTSEVTLPVNLNSSVQILDTATSMTIDGQSVAAQFYYKGSWKSDWDGEVYYEVTSYTEGTISYTAPCLVDGTHEIAVTSKDVLGNTSVKTWTFTVAQPPVFKNIQPANGAIVSNKPIIMANISDPNGNLDPTKISLMVDNLKVEPQLVNNNGTITLTYSSDDLSNDTYHNVVLTAVDLAGNTATTTWKFFACAIGQNSGFSRYSPAINTQVSSLPNISVHLTDLGMVYDRAHITFSIDGTTPVNPVITGRDTEFLLSYTPQSLSDGVHNVRIYVPTLAVGGTPLTTTWSFAVNIPPVITKYSPTYTVTNALPALSAYATDNSAIASAMFTIDGTPLTGNIDRNYNRISAQVLAPLNTGLHEASLTVVDTKGNEVTSKWTFKVDTNIGPQFPEMAVASNNTCWQCHQKEYNWGHVPPSQCLNCHTKDVIKNVQFRDCLGCHYDTKYITREHSYRTEWSWTWNNLPNRRHAITDNHLSSSTDCTECHSRILTQEHNRPGRTDTNGNAITCDTCHAGTGLGTEEATKVKGVIANKDTKCESCHTQGGHLTIHNSGMEAKCTQSGCHNGNLQTEHIGNVTTAGKGYTCNTCHESTRNEVTRAIRNNQLSCSSCHPTAHTIPLTDSVPVDIPTYKGLTFTKPIDAAIFAGDQGLPSDFENSYKTGLVVFSNRAVLDITGVWSFYKTELLSKGWQLKSPEPGSNPVYFSAQFEKYGRKLTVRCYNTSFGDNTGPMCTGYRVDIWYR